MGDKFISMAETIVSETEKKIKEYYPDIKAEYNNKSDRPTKEKAPKNLPLINGKTRKDLLFSLSRYLMNFYLRWYDRRFKVKVRQYTNGNCEIKMGAIKVLLTSKEADILKQELDKYYL